MLLRRSRVAVLFLFSFFCSKSFIVTLSFYAGRWVDRQRVGWLVWCMGWLDHGMYCTSGVWWRSAYLDRNGLAGREIHMHFPAGFGTGVCGNGWIPLIGLVVALGDTCVPIAHTQVYVMVLGVRVSVLGLSTMLVPVPPLKQLNDPDR